MSHHFRVFKRLRRNNMARRKPLKFKLLQARRIKLKPTQTTKLIIVPALEAMTSTKPNKIKKEPKMLKHLSFFNQKRVLQRKYPKIVIKKVYCKKRKTKQKRLKKPKCTAFKIISTTTKNGTSSTAKTQPKPITKPNPKEKSTTPPPPPPKYFGRSPQRKQVDIAKTKILLETLVSIVEEKVKKEHFKKISKWLQKQWIKDIWEKCEILELSERGHRLTKARFNVLTNNLMGKILSSKKRSTAKKKKKNY